MNTTGDSTLERSLHDRGRRMTRQRQAVYDIIVTAQEHLSAEEVYERLRRNTTNISLATVYNALEALVECGQIAKIPRTDDGPARYDWQVGAHHHARCVECGKIWDIDGEAVVVHSKDSSHRFKAIGYKVEMIVACPQDCQVCRLKTEPVPA